MSASLKQLEAAKNSAAAKFWKAEGKVKMRAARRLIGKCFIYPRNCYSCPEKESDYWPIYMRVLGVEEHAWFRTIQIQCDKDGKVTIEPRTATSMGSWVEISLAELQAGINKIQPTITKLLEEAMR